ncbi:response regulator transcription factor [Parahaliea mediterranea]|uniref:response regulator transcription factor n=1 Tax=Parahaliea mediterranea TaxID=651086 RepID=UPI000E2F2899|nr:LuxR C-terminal-related transcriptional regulator [Parahaliea mediterranea]
MITAPPIQFPNRFQQESLNLIERLLPVDSSGFYLVGADMRHSGVVLHNISADAERRYTQRYQFSDPLHPRHFHQSEVCLVNIDEVVEESELLQSDYYRSFMAPLGHRHVTDMYFRRDGDVVAIMTLLRTVRSGPFRPDELAILRSLQPFLQYSLNATYVPARQSQRSAMQARYGLTDRELDVVEQVVSGASNKRIAQELSLSLATVKTHLQHIFYKMKVSSRTEMSARILGDLDADA